MRFLFYLSVILLLISVSCTHKNEIKWKPAENPIMTKWAADVDPSKPWPQYPRPDMVRNEWQNLNGLWEYAITPNGNKPETWSGSILVPYPVESALSGVRKKVTENENLWYRTTFTMPGSWKKKHLLLNFEACDFETTIWIDGKQAGNHRGGYDPFSFDITDFLSRQSSHELIVCVWDPTDKGTQPRGKQVSEPGSIWYTSTTGIWQTVWMEPVSATYISSFRIVTDADKGTVAIKADVNNSETGIISVSISKDGNNVVSGEGSPGKETILQLKDPVLWTPENPFLYDINIELKENGKKTDEIKTYTGIRKISLGKAGDNFTRILLNNKFIYQNGPLDQGFWPDGIYTPPTEEAMVNDLQMTKKMGFNMLRKHVKVENRIFYNWCDRLGILVWQDMPSGDQSIWGDLPDITRSEESASEYVLELKRMIDTKYNHPSIIMWVPFNEGWGQFETGKITSLISAYDPTRLVNSSSGWTDRGTGDINDIHHYPEPAVQPAEEKRAIVLGEFGGLGLPLQGHTWEQKNWGYRNMTDTLQLLAKYESYFDMVHKYVNANGLSASIYTQTTDVETETNGLMTYDREINKMGIKNVFNANNNIIPPALSSSFRIFTENFKIDLNNTREGGKIYYTLDGTEPSAKSMIYTSPFNISETTVLKAYTKWEDAQSRIITCKIEKKKPMNPAKTGNLTSGLKASVYSGRFDALPDFSTLVPVKTLTTKEVSCKIAGQDSLFAIVFDGYLQIPSDGVYSFSVSSDDGSCFFIDDTSPVLNDGIHGIREESRTYPLSKGYHKIKIEYFQRTGGIGLAFDVESPGEKKMSVPSNWLFN